jgi:hypothetical protein
VGYVTEEKYEYRGGRKNRRGKGDKRGEEKELCI